VGPILAAPSILVEQDRRSDGARPDQEVIDEVALLRGSRTGEQVAHLQRDRTKLEDAPPIGPDVELAHDALEWGECPGIPQHAVAAAGQDQRPFIHLDAGAGRIVRTQPGQWDPPAVPDRDGQGRLVAPLQAVAAESSRVVDVCQPVARPDLAHGLEHENDDPQDDRDRDAQEGAGQ